MTTTVDDYHLLSKYYDSCLEKHGATPKGVDWPNQQDLHKRFDVMLRVLKLEDKTQPISILDLGCGYGALLAHMQQHLSYLNIAYTGIDISEKMIAAAQAEHPQFKFMVRDILQNPLQAASYDYIIMNGLFTEKRTLSWEAMYAFMTEMLRAAFKICRKGMAFNVMNYHVDWSDTNLFHCSFDDTANAVIENCSRHFQFRADYGLYEYTTYVYQSPNSA